MSFRPYPKGKGAHLCAFGHDMGGAAVCMTCRQMDKIARKAADEADAKLLDPPTPGDEMVMTTGDGEVIRFKIGPRRPGRRRR